MANQDETPNSGPKQSRTSQNEIPIFTLKQALKIAQAIWDNFAGKGAAPH